LNHSTWRLTFIFLERITASDNARRGLIILDQSPYPGYNLSQRLSDDHPPLRIGNLSAPAVLPRVRSEGLLPPGCPLRLFPVEKPLRVLHRVCDEADFEAKTGITRERREAHTRSLVFLRNKRLLPMAA